MSKSFQKFKKKFGKVIVTAGLIATTTMSVFADSKATTNHAVNFRDAGSMKSNVIETLPKGAELNVLDDSTNWVKVEYNGKTGYVYKAYLETNKVGTVKVGSSRLNVRNKASMSGKIIGKLNTGDKVSIKGESSSWYMIDYKGKTAFVSKKYVKVSSTQISEVEECDDMFRAEMGCNVRTGPSTSYSKIGYIIKGQAFHVKGKCSNGWYLIQCGSKEGYISPKYLMGIDKFTDDTILGTMVVDTKSDETLNLRDGGGMKYKILDEIPNDTVVFLVKDPNPVNGWTRVRYNNLNGYVATKYLKKGDVTPNEPPVIECVDELTYTVGDKFNKDDLKLVVTDKEYDDDFTPRATIDTSKLDMTKAGTYVILIQATDDDGATTTKEVKVIVKDKDTPVIPPVENTKPTISAKTEITLTVGDTFSKDLLEIKATDKEDGNLIDKVQIEGEVDTSKAGTYTLILIVEDSNGATASTTVNVIVKEKEVPNTDPVISAKEDLTLTVGDTFNKDLLNIKATDKEDGNLTDKVKIEGEVDTSKAGTYTLKLSVEDSKGAKAEKQISVIVKEKEVPNTNPVITCKDEITLTVGDSYSKLKELLDLKVTDKEDGDLTDKVGIDTLNLDLEKAGEYKIIIEVEDSKGASSRKEVKVIVKEKEVPNTKPTITCKEDLTLTVGDTFDKNLLEIKATDKEDGNLIDKVVIEGEVDTSKAGEYTLTLTVQDSKSETASITVKVIVKEKEVPNTDPVITCKDEITLTVGDEFNKDLLEIKATDKEDGNLIDKVKIDTSQLDLSKAGTYTITISVEDSKGAKVEKQVKVIVEEKEVPNTPPILHVEDLTINCGDKFDYREIPVRAMDREDDEVSDIKYIGVEDVNPNKVGEYKVKIIVSDSQGLTTEGEATVIVKATNPVITASDITLDQGDNYTDTLIKASAKDCEGSSIDVKIDSSSVDTSKTGTYEVKVTATDKWGNTVTKTVAVTIKEVPNEKPTITAASITINCGDSYDNSMLNAKAEDKEDGTIKDISYNGDVNPNKVGEYEVTITATDSKGETGSITVTVTVKSVKPTITAKNATIEVGDSVTKSTINASAKDCEGTTLAVSLDKSNLNTSKAGTYDVKVSATDKWGNTATKTVKVTVKEKEVQGYKVNSPECRRIIQDEMYRLVNEHRANNGKDALTVSSALENTAYLKSEDMGINNYFDHQVDGKFIWEYKDCADADGENIALCGWNGTNGKLTEQDCKDLAKSLFNQWKNSAGHNASMISKLNKSIGFDLYLVDRGNDAYTVYATQEFRIK